MADTQDINLLTRMIETGGCYLDCQQQQGDKESTSKMEGILSSLNEMVAEEIKEPSPTPPDGMPMSMMPTGY